MQSSQGKNGKFGAGIAAVQIFGGVGFGVPARLGLFQCLAERDSRILDPAQNVVAGSIQNPGNAMQSVAAQSGAQRGENRNSTRDRSTELQSTSMAGGELQKIRAMPRNQLLVGRYHRLSRLQRGPHNPLRRI